MAGLPLEQPEKGHRHRHGRDYTLRVYIQGIGPGGPVQIIGIVLAGHRGAFIAATRHAATRHRGRRLHRSRRMGDGIAAGASSRPARSSRSRRPDHARSLALALDRPRHPWRPFSHGCGAAAPPSAAAVLSSKRDDPRDNEKNGQNEPPHQPAVHRYPPLDARSSPRMARTPDATPHPWRRVGRANASVTGAHRSVARPSIGLGQCDAQT